MVYKIPTDKQRLNTFIVYTVGGEKLQIVANRYIINRDAQTIDFFTDEDERRDDLMLFVHGVVMIQRAAEEVPEAAQRI
ncbi:MAG TPA: hypothetical protein VFZ34_20835 [Blastocatellia bacterium]|nr:hypothetical protein [Blastocatellia bacterium]